MHQEAVHKPKKVRCLFFLKLAVTARRLPCILDLVATMTAPHDMAAVAFEGGLFLCSISEKFQELSYASHPHNKALS
jgi:hypothetical protein